MNQSTSSGVQYPQRRHDSLEDELRMRARESAQPETGSLTIIASWDDRLSDLPLDTLFFTALNQRACILMPLSEDAFPDPDVIENVLRSGDLWTLHFAAFLQAKHPILRVNLAFPDDPRNPYWLEAPLNLSDGDIQDFCEALLAEEMIDIIIKHQSFASGQYTVAFSAKGAAKILRNEVRSVTQKFGRDLTIQDFNDAYILLQQVYPNGSAGLDPNKWVGLEFAGRARNKFIHFNPYETPEKREERERKEEAEEREREQQELQGYIDQLLSIQNVLDFDAGTEACKALGNEINERWGFQGMVTVVEYIRDHHDRTKARSIERAWDGIGEWMG